MGVQITLSAGDVTETILGPLPPEQEAFKIPIPGWDEVVKIVPTAFKTPEQRIEEKRRIARQMKDSPVPQWAQQVGRVMTVIDNAEDFLSTAIFLARPIFRKTAQRVTPVLGWVLTGRDVAEAFMVIGRLVTLGGGGKRSGIDFFRSLSLKKGARLRRTQRFLTMKPGAGVLIEGLQTSENLSGTGLSLGPVMGAITTTNFGAIQTARGAKVEFLIDPEQRLFFQAARVLIDAAIVILAAIFLPFATALLLWISLEIALQTVQSLTDPDLLIQLFEPGINTDYPQWFTTNPDTRQALEEVEVNPDADWPPILPFESTDPTTFGTVTDAMLQWYPTAFEGYKSTFGSTSAGTFTCMGAIQMGVEFWNWLDPPDNHFWANNMADSIISQWLEAPTPLQRRIFPAPAA